MPDYVLDICPHCGGTGKLRTDTIVIGGNKRTCAWVYCTRCNCKTNYFAKAVYKDYIDRATIAWNMRISEDLCDVEETDS